MLQEEAPRRIGALVAALILGTLAVVAAFYTRPYEPTADPALLVSGENVIVERRDFGLVFNPKTGSGDLGFAFYPAARVPPEAYAYLGRALAESGYPSVILSAPLNFAILAPAKAGDAAKAYPAVRAWVLGGHSLGGGVAAARAARHPESVAGLLLVAAWPGRGANLRGASLPVLSLSASEDGIATQARIAAASQLLPSAARYVSIAGGNHAQFGEYGSQPGDGEAGIPAESQRHAVVAETRRFLAEAAKAATQP